jgi:hypothetical protein
VSDCSYCTARISGVHRGMVEGKVTEKTGKSGQAADREVPREYNMKTYRPEGKQSIIHFMYFHF